MSYYVALFLLGTSQDVLNGFEQDVLKTGFECWRTQMGGEGVTFHFTPISGTVLPDSFHVL